MYPHDTFCEGCGVLLDSCVCVPPENKSAVLPDSNYCVDCGCELSKYGPLGLCDTCYRNATAGKDDIRDTEVETTANSIQHGGDHYKAKAIQPWDYIVSNNLGFLEGNAVKYLSRWREKNGIEDLRKAIHYIEKLIEIENERNQN